MQVLRANIHKILCGALVALALATLPLPALADNEAQQPEVITENVSTNKDAADKPVVDAGTPTKTTAPTPVEETTTESDTKPISDKPATSQVQADQSPNASGKVQNDVNSSATSGSATVAENEKANDALSGDATATSTTINVANTNGANAGSFQTFECNITEDRDSDILIDPMALPGFCQSTIAGSSAQPSASGQGLQTGANLTEILNNIVLSATSGDATVNGNETAGNATSGNATALANVLNIANTNIDAKNSFLGVVNIYADLKGDILVPQSFVDGLANGSSAQSSGDMTTNITNAINASATSGEALAADNGTVGNTTSGEAMTSLTVLNLTGQEVIARNSLLVFINVLGKWMGMIVPAPGSANKSGTAMLGSGLQGSGSVTQPSAAKSTANTTTNITNNISVATKSGDASITDNEKAGNATSGKAAAGVNLLNITNSNFRLDDWFGALFINVLGSWTGDLDIQANAPTTSTEGNAGQVVRAVQVYRFEAPAVVPAATNTSTTESANDVAVAEPVASSDITTISTPTSAVLSASTDTPAQENVATASSAMKLDMITLGAIILALTLLIAVASLAIRRKLTA